MTEEGDFGASSCNRKLECERFYTLGGDSWYIKAAQLPSSFK